MDGARRVLRQLLIASLLAAVVVTCLRLGWWQWQRYHSTSGSLQNLGYTLQWPTFAAFAIFMWWRLSRLERQRRERAEPSDSAASQPSTTDLTEQGEPKQTEPNRANAELGQADQNQAGPGQAGLGGPTPAAAPARPRGRQPQRLAARPGSVQPAGTPDRLGSEADDPDDAELAAYNRYLAQLHAADTAGSSRERQDGT